MIGAGRYAAPGRKEAASPPLIFGRLSRCGGGRAAQGYGAAPSASRPGCDGFLVIEIPASPDSPQMADGSCRGSVWNQEGRLSDHESETPIRTALTGGDGDSHDLADTRCRRTVRLSLSPLCGTVPRPPLWRLSPPEQADLAFATFLAKILMPAFFTHDRPGRASPRKTKKAGDFPARKPGEPSVTKVTRTIEFHLLCPWQLT